MRDDAHTAVAYPEVAEAIDAVRRATHPRGMPPDTGLLYQPVPLVGFEGVPAERDSTPERLELLARRLDYRGARLLDLGCANGYFLLRLAAGGVIEGGLGIDYFAPNVDLARAVARALGVADAVAFERGAVGAGLVEQLTRRQRWDVCHLLSVHHHLVRSLGVDEVRGIFRTLHERTGAFVVEQGSLTQDEYEAWTGRSEPFATRAWSRLCSMFEACGVPLSACRVVGHGWYAKGLRPDREGAPRAIVAATHEPGPGTVRRIHRKYHRNGVTMEILECESGAPGELEVFKQVVAGTPRSAREVAALVRLAGTPGFARLADPDAAEREARHGLVRMAGPPLRPIEPADLAGRGEAIRAACVERAMALARAGIVHCELSPEHLLLDPHGDVVVIDFETAWFAGEPPEAWRAEVLDPNPALGLGWWDPHAVEGAPVRADLDALDNLFAHWGLRPLTGAERRRYAEHLASAAPARS